MEELEIPGLPAHQPIPMLAGEPAEPFEGESTVIRELMNDERVLGARISATGQVLALGADGPIEGWTHSFRGPEAVERMLDEFDISEEDGCVVNRAIAGCGLSVDFLLPPLSTAGIVIRVRRSPRNRLPVTELVKQNILNNDEAREFVRSLTLGRSLLVCSPDTQAVGCLLASAIYHMPGKPRIMALGSDVPCRDRDAGERIDVSMQAAVEDPDGFNAALESFGPDWIVAASVSPSNIAAMLPRLWLAQVPAVLICRLREGSDLGELMVVGDELSSEPIGRKLLANMLHMLNPLIVKTRIDTEGRLTLEGLFNFRAEGERLILEPHK